MHFASPCSSLNEDSYPSKVSTDSRIPLKENGLRNCESSYLKIVNGNVFTESTNLKEQGYKKGQINEPVIHCPETLDSFGTPTPEKTSFSKLFQECQQQ